MTNGLAVERPFEDLSAAERQEVMDDQLRTGLQAVTAPREFADLSDAEKGEVITGFHEAATLLARSWDAFRRVEKILGRELNVDLNVYAIEVPLNLENSSFSASQVAEALI